MFSSKYETVTEQLHGKHFLRQCDCCNRGLLKFQGCAIYEWYSRFDTFITRNDEGQVRVLYFCRRCDTDKHGMGDEWRCYYCGASPAYTGFVHYMPYGDIIKVACSEICAEMHEGGDVYVDDDKIIIDGLFDHMCKGEILYGR